MKLHPFVAAEKELAVAEARSPGMKHKHYAPNAKLVLVEGSVPAVIEKVRELDRFMHTYGQQGGSFGYG